MAYGREHYISCIWDWYSAHVMLSAPRSNNEGSKAYASSQPHAIPLGDKCRGQADVVRSSTNNIGHKERETRGLKLYGNIWGSRCRHSCPLYSLKPTYYISTTEGENEMMKGKKPPTRTTPPPR